MWHHLFSASISETVILIGTFSTLSSQHSTPNSTTPTPTNLVDEHGFTELKRPYLQTHWCVSHLGIRGMEFLSVYFALPADILPLMTGLLYHSTLLKGEKQRFQHNTKHHSRQPRNLFKPHVPS